MNVKIIHKIIGTIVYLFTIIVLFMTVQPSVSFWDCGELSAASYLLQVSHPPGAPLFFMVNKFVTLFPFAENIGFRVNTLTVIASSFSVLFLYLIAVKLINKFKRNEYAGNLDYIVTYIAAAIGALSLAFGETFWFNATESNVFGFSTFLYTLMIWLLMVWYEKADEPDSNRILILVAFIIGLSPGVHLMSVLAAVPLGMLFVMKKFTDDEETAKSSGKLLLANIAILIAVAFFIWSTQTKSTAPSQAEFKSFDTTFKFVLLAVTIVFMAVFRKKVFAKSSLYYPFIAGIGINFIVYPGIVKYIPQIITSVIGNDLFVNSFFYILLIAVLTYTVYWSAKNKRSVLNLAAACVLFATLGVTVYALVIIRANQETPMNESSPKDFSSLVSYLSREQYGDFPTFKRRYSAEPQHRQIWSDYSSDLDYLLKWQINHQYNRYLFWNYIGREGSIQDMGVDAKKLFGIPFIIGMLGLFFHFRRDWKMASVFLTMFIFMGFLICFYQDQQQVQPRERDYFYAGSFFVFSIWIALGIRGIIDEVWNYMKKPNKAVAFSLLLIGLVFIPLNMLRTNYFDHDRSKNWVPWDYAYNILQSCAPNAILFTCGDNDTFPLWYLQDVEGVRRDIRIANLSLINTNWHPKQLKNNTPYGAMKVSMSYTDDQLDKLLPMEWKPKVIDIPVPKSVYAEFGITDTAIINQGKMSFLMNPTIGEGNVKGIRNQDLLIKDIIEQNKWQRPVYFASTCDPGSKIGLDDYTKLEGLAYRLTPYKYDKGENVDIDLTSKALFGENLIPNKEFQRGFNLRSFDQKMFFDENQQRIVNLNYRNTYITFANFYLHSANNPEMCKKTLEVMEKRFPENTVPYDIRILYSVAGLYYEAGDYQKSDKYLNETENIANDIIKSGKNDRYEIQSAQYILNQIRLLKDSLNKK